MDKRKEIEKIEFIIGSTIRECEQKDCIRNCEFARRKDCKYYRAAKDLVNSGYGDTKAAIKEFITKFNENLVISFSLTDSVDAIADRVSKCVDSCLLSTAKEYGVVLTKEG